ncbi:MAG TPA: SusC/RagA family TonB-linked outer membrane protein [Bacteroidia bacterium]|nr:SusC/RagA family TonB-linked outer membrane protein [Bacteroidia bacterium]
MRTILSLTILLLVISLTSTFGQNIKVTGTVLNSDGEAMPFLTVAVAGTTNATLTDVNGNYAIENISSTDTLNFSFIGYISQSVKVGDQTVINVKLLVKTQELNEVVVTALGVNRQKRELGYSTEKVGGDEILKSNAPNVLNALTGKTSGVQIANPDGVDGGTTRITIRGNNNISGNNQPLIVVDGIPMNNDPGLTDVGRGKDWGSAINNINAADIESMNILKGGAASALYGARGANGVVLITTKKGSKQKGLGVSYNFFYKTTTPYRYRDVQNKYGGGAPSTNFSAPAFELGADNIPLFPSLATDPQFGYPGSSVSWGPEMTGQTIRWWDGSLRSWSPQPDNLKLPFQNGHTTTHNISAEGGGEAGTMRVSISKSNTTPIVDNSNLDQTTINTNSTLKVSEKVSVNLAASYVDFHRLNSPMLGEDPESFSKGQLYSWPRSYQGEDLQNYALPDGTRNPQTGYPYLYINNYLWWNYYNNNTTLDRSKFLGGLTLNYKIMPWLSFMGRTGIDYTLDEFQQKNKPADLIGLLDGYYSESQQNDKSLNSEFLFTASKKNIFKSDFNIDVNVGGSSWDRDMHSISAHSGTWYYPNWYSLSNYTPTVYGQDSNGNVIIVKQGDDPSELVPVNSFYRKKINSIYSFIHLDYKNYLFVELTGRNDWSSTLPADANSYFYPGISVSYIASEALKFKNKWLSYCKIRGGAAQTATDTEPYQTEFYYATSLFGGDQSSAFPAVIPPIALKPQRVNTYEIGTNLGFFEDRIVLDFTYYYKYSFDQILKTPLPLSAGSSAALINEGAISNRGFELLINATVYNGKKLLIKSGINITRNRNTVESLGDYGNTYILADIWGENGPQMALHEGDDFGTIIGWDYVYKDGQRVVSDDGTKYLMSDERVPIGNSSPHFLAGWTTEFRYKNFTLNTLIDTKWGGDMYSGSYVTGLQSGQSPETLSERDGGGLPYTNPSGVTSNSGVILEGVHQDGSPNTTVVHYYNKYMPNAGGWGHFLSKPGIVEDTWVKMREINLTYNLQKSALSKLKIFQELSFTFTARDLFYIYSSVPDRINPEGLMGAGDAQGFEWASLPGVRSFAFGINAKF